MRICYSSWKKIFGLSAFFTLVFLMIAVTGPQGINQVDIVASPKDYESGKNSFSQAVSFVGGKLKLLVVYNKKLRNDDEDEDDDYNDIVVEEGTSDEVEQYDDDEESYNKVFEVGDFDYGLNVTEFKNTSAGNGVLKDGTTVNAVTELFTIRTMGNETAKSNTPFVEDKIFWGESVETLAPKGITEKDVESFLRRMHRLKVISAEPPTWNRCGRPKNQFIIFEDGTQACARYRAPHSYLVQGEVMSFYLARLLGIRNVPPVTLLAIDSRQQWSNPKVNKSLELAGWLSNETVAVIQWIDALERDRMPQILLDALLTGHPISSSNKDVSNMTDSQLVELLQWSDLILFDYITGNYDRVASMQDAADREKKSSILGETIHNLVRSRHKEESLWLIDNESGLLDAYSLLYGQSGSSRLDSNRFINFHNNTLNSVCLFRRSTYNRIKWLAHQPSAVNTLTRFILRKEPHFRKLPKVSRYAEFVKNFSRRLREAQSHMDKCRMS